jgi:hypothetical protein
MQSSRVRLMLVALLGVFAFAAVAAAAAQAEEAPRWTIGGKILEKGETHFITAKIYTTTENPVFTLQTGLKTITCGAVRLASGVLLGSSAGNPGTNNEVIEFFGKCKVTGNGTGCKVKEPIKTRPVKSELVETEKGTKASLLVEFKPAEENVKEFTKIEFEAEAGGKCEVASTAVSGEVVACVRTDPKTGGIGELITLESEKKEATSWLLETRNGVSSVWLIAGGEGKQREIGLKERLTAFGEEATLKGVALVLLADKNGKTEETNWSPLP